MEDEIGVGRLREWLGQVEERVEEEEGRRAVQEGSTGSGEGREEGKIGPAGGEHGDLPPSYRGDW